MGNVLILNYHEILPDIDLAGNTTVSHSEFSVKKSDLIVQIESIIELGIPIVSFEEWNKHPESNRFSVVLTFSGGYKSDREIVLPFLQSKNLIATFFPTHSEIGLDGKLTWEDLQILVDCNMVLGSQGVSDKNLGRLSKKACQLELELSKRIFENKTGKKINYFAPRYGTCNRRLLQLAYNAGYQKVIVNRTKFNSRNNGLLLHQTTIKSSTSKLTLEKLFAKGLLLHSRTRFFTKLATQLSMEFGIGLFNKMNSKKTSSI